MSCSFSCIASREVDSFWPLIEPLLEKVKDRDWVPEDVRHQIRSQKAQLWVVGKFDGVLVTKLEVTGSVKRCVLWIASGEGLKIGKELLYEVIEPWARQHGCSYVQLIGRKGWKRALPDYRECAIMYEKTL